jgi:hypothetical protein
MTIDLFSRAFHFVIILLGLFLHVIPATAQPIVWNRNYGGSGKDYPGETIKCSEPGYIAVVSSNSTNGEKSVSKGGFDIGLFALIVTEE